MKFAFVALSLSLFGYCNPVVAVDKKSRGFQFTARCIPSDLTKEKTLNDEVSSHTDSSLQCNSVNFVGIVPDSACVEISLVEAFEIIGRCSKESKGRKIERIVLVESLPHEIPITVSYLSHSFDLSSSSDYAMISSLLDSLSKYDLSVLTNFPDRPVSLLGYVDKAKRSFFGKPAINYRLKKWLSEQISIEPHALAVNWETALITRDEYSLHLLMTINVPHVLFANYAASAGFYTVVETFANQYNVYPDQSGADQAAINGHDKIVKFLFENASLLPLRAAFIWAVRNGHIEVVIFLDTLEEDEYMIDLKLANTAASLNQVEIIKYFVREHPLVLHTQTTDYACASGGFGALWYLLGTSYPSYNCANWATERGHEETLDWLAGNGFIHMPTSVKSVRRAFLRGHVSMLDYLKKHSYDFTQVLNGRLASQITDASTWAFIHYHLHSAIKPNIRTANQAAITGRVSCLKYFYNYPRRSVKGLLPEQAAFSVAAVRGLPRTVEFGFKHNMPPSDQSILAAARLGRLEVIKVVAENDPSLITTELSVKAAEAGQIHIVAYIAAMHKNRSNDSSFSSLSSN